MNEYELLKRATEQAILAYQFSPGSYTYSAMQAIYAAAKPLPPDWIAEVQAWNE